MRKFSFLILLLTAVFCGRAQDLLVPSSSYKIYNRKGMFNFSIGLDF